MDQDDLAGLGANLGPRVAERRRWRKLSGQQLAVAAGVSIDAVRSIESGRVANPGIVTVTRLAAVLGASLDELTGLRDRLGRSDAT